MSPPTTASTVLSHYENLASSLYASNTYTPPIYPLHALSPLLFLAYMILIPPLAPSSSFYKPVSYIRFPLFAFLVYTSVKTVRGCRTASPTVAYGIGLLIALGLMWAATALVFADARRDFARWERRDGRGRVRRRDEKGEGEGDGKRRKEREEQNEAAGLDGGIGALKNAPASRRRETRKAELQPRSSDGRNAEINVLASSSSDGGGASSGQLSDYIFQPLPSTFLHRLEWVVDLIFSLRGINWSYRGPHQPPRWPYNSPSPSRSELLRSTIFSLILHYFLLDMLKTLTLYDPYFLTLPAPSSSSPFPFPYFSRLLLSVVLCYTSLQTIFLLAPFFACLLGPSILGRYAEPALYPPYYRSLRLIATQGLAGFWSGTWHQILRVPLVNIGEYFAAQLGSGWEKRTRRGRILRMITAFMLSGMLHATASFTTLPPTKPLSEAFLFFAIQPVGILTQQSIAELIRHKGWREGIPGWAREAASTAFVLLWLFSTGPLLARDFGQNGIWLFEPVPISFARGGRWCWGGQWVKWWGKGKWWERGLAF